MEILTNVLWTSSNSLSLHYLLSFPIACILYIFLSPLIVEKLVDRFLGIVQAAYNIGGHVISANAIEYSILCFRAPRMGRVLSLLSLKHKDIHERK